MEINVSLSWEGLNMRLYYSHNYYDIHLHVTHCFQIKHLFLYSPYIYMHVTTGTMQMSEQADETACKLHVCTYMYMYSVYIMGNWQTFGNFKGHRCNVPTKFYILHGLWYRAFRWPINFMFTPCVRTKMHAWVPNNNHYYIIVTYIVSSWVYGLQLPNLHPLSLWRRKGIFLFISLR